MVTVTVTWRQHLRSDSKTVTGRMIYRSKADNGDDKLTLAVAIDNKLSHCLLVAGRAIRSPSFPPWGNRKRLPETSFQFHDRDYL